MQRRHRSWRRPSSTLSRKRSRSSALHTTGTGACTGEQPVDRVEVCLLHGEYGRGQQGGGPEARGTSANARADPCYQQQREAGCAGGQDTCGQVGRARAGGIVEVKELDVGHETEQRRW